MAKDRKGIAQTPEEIIAEIEPEAIHGYFELSYAQYLTVPRTALQSMPEEWQTRFVACLRELDESFDWRPREGYQFWVQMRGAGHFVKLVKHEPFMDYKRGRRRVIRWQEAHPCVNCGSNAEIHYLRRDAYRLECIRCEISFGMGQGTIMEALEVWNTANVE
jgi:hypothetical protein